MRKFNALVVLALLMASSGGFAKTCVLSMGLEFDGHGWGFRRGDLYCDGDKFDLHPSFWKRPTLVGESDLLSALTQQLSYVQGTYHVKLSGSCSRSEGVSNCANAHVVNVGYVCTLSD